MPILILLSIVTSLSWATVKVGDDDCPQQFKGRAREVINDLGPEKAFSTQKVIFTNDETLKGEVKDQVIVEVLKNGPFEIRTGDEYLVKMRSGKICWIEHL